MLIHQPSVILQLERIQLAVGIVTANCDGAIPLDIYLRLFQQHLRGHICRVHKDESVPYRMLPRRYGYMCPDGHSTPTGFRTLIQSAFGMCV